MKALMKTGRGYGNVELRDVEEPVCADNSVKIEVRYTGICGTDLHILHDTFMNYPPVVLGHEFSGVIAEVGAAVKHHRVGSRVTVLPSTAVTCGTCSYCRQGKYMFCPQRRGMGYGVHGSFTKYVVVREDMVYRLPDHIPLEVAALAEPLACAVNALEELTSIQAGDRVLISGPGPIGLLCLALLVGRGIRVVVAGTTEDAERLQLARKLGADLTVDVLKEDLHSIVQAETGGLGMDVAIECAGAGPSISNCLHALKKMGKFIQVGIAGKQVTLDYDLILFKQIQLYGSVGHSLSTWDRVIRIFEQNKIRLQDVITHQFPLSQWQEAFELCEKKRGGKVLLYYDDNKEGGNAFESGC
ncbi:zinc-dependent alcohol dehydrogenase [Paenibacillus thalictri]|uniref:Zn-dependent alcohol dehydrogenase n=1 Tax=Paenibacillus thalictri TaxID=2527873 RepID=A0A4Q9DED4_9BACL|nr:zinc-binding dehydrogenase [Paenibacillus thalictri]TBL69893.1 Zn-dependent alcohol dehydrogenase [Paenibacillus thalictri]